MNKLSVWIKDYAYLFSTGAVMYFRHAPPKHYLDHVIDGKAPVIILPGIFGRWAFMKSIADHISRLGHPVYIVPKLGNNVKSIPVSSKEVRQVVEENALTNAVIVAHSKGGLIGKYVLLHEDPDARIKGLVAIATPFHGSSIAKLIPLRSVAELDTNSEIILYLDSHSEVNGKIVSIIPSYDNHVWHKDGSYLDGAMGNIRVEAAGHDRILSDKKVWNVVIDSIDRIAKKK